MASKKIDRYDKKILNLLQKNNRITNISLADKVGLSAPATLRRVRRLRESGIIESEVAILSPALVGKLINIIVEVEVESIRKDLSGEFVKLVRAAPEVTQCYKVTGEIDFILIVSVDNMQVYEEFVQRVLMKTNNLRKFRTLISMKREKFETAIGV